MSLGGNHVLAVAKTFLALTSFVKEGLAGPSILVRTLTPNRRKLALLVWGMIVLALPALVRAQEAAGDAPLGDVARSFRKKTPPPDAVIDNDNLSKVVDDAESRRAAGSSPVFSLDPGGKNFHVSSPDVTCSLSFSAKTTSLLSDPMVLDELPREELAKLDGPATIEGDSLQVSMHNGTAWELREVVIGLTIVKRLEPAEISSYYGQARIIPAVADGQPAPDSFQKRPDVTLLLRVKGSAAPSTTATFRTPLNFALFPDQEWHWAIVKAKGIPPQSPPVEVTTTQPEPGTGQLLPGSREASLQIAPAIPSASNSSSPRPDAAAH
jgi:hypothetical protein